MSGDCVGDIGWSKIINLRRSTSRGSGVSADICCKNNLDLVAGGGGDEAAPICDCDGRRRSCGGAGGRERGWCYCVDAKSISDLREDSGISGDRVAHLRKEKERERG